MPITAGSKLDLRADAFARCGMAKAAYANGR